jgi:hypothetical protein
MDRPGKMKKDGLDAFSSNPQATRREWIETER